MRGQPAQVTEVGRSLHGAAGKADQRATLTGLMVCEPCAIGDIDACHAAIICGPPRLTVTAEQPPSTTVPAWPHRRPAPTRVASRLLPVRRVACGGPVICR